MASSWVFNIVYVLDGEYVKSAVINRPLDQLVQRTDYLYELVNSLTAGQLLIVPNVTIEPGLLEGQAVCYDSVDERFEGALSEIETGQNNYGYPTARAYVRGMILVKHTENTADIALAGRIPAAVYDNIDWSVVSDTSAQLIGVVNLSAVTPGNMSQVSSNLTVQLGTLDGEGNMYLMPDVNGDLRQHLHYKFQLTENLGTAITDLGWLAAAVFTGEGISVPAGYTYGYNVSTDTDLAAHFPPVPLVAHSLFIDGLLVEETEDYLVDEVGIWYKGTDTPWSKPTCFYTVELATNTTTVTSARPSATGIPVQTEDADGNAAVVGDLRLRLDPGDLFDEEDEEALYALVPAEAGGTKLRYATMIRRVFPGVNITIESANGDDDDGHFGDLTIHAGVGTTVQLAPVLAELVGTAETRYQEVLVVSFPQGRTGTAVSYSIPIPTNVSSTRKVKLQLELIAAAAVNDNLNFDYKLLRRDVAVPATWTSLTAVAMGVTAGGVPDRIESAEINCEPGDTVLLRVTQPATTPSYDLFISRSWAVIGG